jgi:hypothetical protein
MNNLLDSLQLGPLKQALDKLGAWFAELNLNSVDLALIASLVVSWAALVLALSAIKKIKKQSATSYRLYEKIVHDLHIASSGAIGMGQRIIAVERKMASGVSNKAEPKPRLQAVPKTEPTTAPANFASLINESIRAGANNLNSSISVPSKFKPGKAKPQPEPLSEEENPFDTAKHLLRRGLDQAEVARRCGLSLSETALMAMVLNNREKQASVLAG